jgi:hypothetical protein
MKINVQILSEDFFNKKLSPKLESLKFIIMYSCVSMIIKNVLYKIKTKTEQEKEAQNEEIYTLQKNFSGEMNIIFNLTKNNLERIFSDNNYKILRKYILSILKFYKQSSILTKIIRFLSSSKQLSYNDYERLHLILFRYIYQYGKFNRNRSNTVSTVNTVNSNTSITVSNNTNNGINYNGIYFNYFKLIIDRVIELMKISNNNNNLNYNQKENNKLDQIIKSLKVKLSNEQTALNILDKYNYNSTLSVKEKYFIIYNIIIELINNNYDIFLKNKNT